LARKANGHPGVLVGPRQADLLDRAAAELMRLRGALVRQGHEIEQTLGRALGYPPLCPGEGTVDHGQVCVGEHTAESLAAEAAETISRLRGERE
jgi:hypothetical protein